jgi:hypothetical protein
MCFVTKASHMIFHINKEHGALIINSGENDAQLHGVNCKKITIKASKMHKDDNTG